MLTLRKLFLKLSESPAYRSGFMAEFEYWGQMLNFMEGNVWNFVTWRQFAKRMEVTRELLCCSLGGCNITKTWQRNYFFATNSNQDYKNLGAHCNQRPDHQNRMIWKLVLGHFIQLLL